MKEAVILGREVENVQAEKQEVQILQGEKRWQDEAGILVEIQWPLMLLRAGQEPGHGAFIGQREKCGFCSEEVESHWWFWQSDLPYSGELSLCGGWAEKTRSRRDDTSDEVAAVV